MYFLNEIKLINFLIIYSMLYSINKKTHFLILLAKILLSICLSYKLLNFIQGTKFILLKHKKTYIINIFSPNIFKILYETFLIILLKTNLLKGKLFYLIKVIVINYINYKVYFSFSV